MKQFTTSTSVVSMTALDVMKDNFYADLQDSINNVPTRAIFVAARDWNARTGPAENATRQIQGQFALGPRSANSERLVDLAAAIRFVVSST